MRGHRTPQRPHLYVRLCCISNPSASRSYASCIGRQPQVFLHAALWLGHGTKTHGKSPLMFLMKQCVDDGNICTEQCNGKYVTKVKGLVFCSRAQCRYCALMDSSMNLFPSFAFCNTSSVMSCPASTITTPLSILIVRVAFLPSRNRLCRSSLISPPFAASAGAAPPGAFGAGAGFFAAGQL